MFDLDNEKYLKQFCEPDPFNTHGLLQNTLGGTICRKPDYRYGALCITTVNGEPVEPQYIYGTPKMHYPIDRGGNWLWPENPIRVKVAHKYDGTNIFGYTYKDAAGKAYRTFKTRLTPTLRPSLYGSWVDLWSEILKDHPNWRDYNDCDVSYELYGSRNQHLVVYDGVRLKATELFDVWGPNDYSPISWEYTIDPESGLTSLYNYLRAQDEQANSKAGKYVVEGRIIWVHDGSRWTPWKCKPETVEALHRRMADGIPEDVIRPTVKNAMQSSCGSTTGELFKETCELLLEDYTQEEVDRVETRIRKLVSEQQKWAEFRGDIAVILSSCESGLDKAGVMRYIAQRGVEKKRMSEAYKAAVELGYINER